MSNRLEKVLLAATLTCVAGCDTMYRAKVVQDEMASVASDNGGDLAPQADFVDLTSFTLQEYVEYAISMPTHLSTLE